MNFHFSQLRLFRRIASFNPFRFPSDVRLFGMYIVPLIFALTLLVRFGALTKGAAWAAVIGGVIGGIVTLIFVLPVKITVSAAQRMNAFSRIAELKYQPSSSDGDAVIYRPTSLKIRQWEANRIVVHERPDASIQLECPLGIAHRFEFDSDSN